MIFITGGAYQGKEAYAREQFPEYEILNAYHLKVREQLLKGQDPKLLAERLLQEKEESRLVLISDEVGCGVVPVDAFEREYRECCGRINSCFAAKAEQVFRVVCGIGVRIK